MEFALFSSSRKAEDSFTFALAGGEEDVAGEETDFLVNISTDSFETI